MLKQAEQGILFRPPQNVTNDYPQFPLPNDSKEIKRILSKYTNLV
jgi:phosphoserine / homoserine phosphotransferase